ncbi:hypothetical protein GOP47_0021455 [Adiantum capillus-veneris]|uniref:Uncharacterized protein n=1 Tax=Adiantum capillus-veneris TaxID=13818 RepID=A0A9D4U7J0_ADICA|nr:hypothetical protein GOP47_0021455 [Adiantum capillus-veneris]
MPKDKSIGSHRCQKVRDHACRPYPSPDLGSATLSGKSLGEDACAGRNEWEGVLCPVCMETPHNAVLLHCSSHDKGCRPYMCDTSYRHSNCLDQYLKAHLACGKTVDGQPGVTLRGDVVSGTGSPEQEASHQNSSMGPFENGAAVHVLQTPRVGGSQRLSKGDMLDLTCPLCRGHVQDCKVVKTARDALNRKVRVCAREACSFSGSYQELRAHARRDHPSARPAEIDPARQHSWVRMEQQRELGDVLSVIQASMPHVTVSGDYAIDVFGSVHSLFGGRPLPPFRGVLRRQRRSGSSRQGLWGEILQQSQNAESNGAATNDPANEVVKPWFTQGKGHQKGHQDDGLRMRFGCGICSFIFIHRTVWDTTILMEDV